MKTAYKIVKDTNGALHSCLLGLNDKQGVVYLVNEWVTRPENGGPMCLFDDLKTAKLFFNMFIFKSFNLYFKIYEAMFIPSKETRIWFTKREYGLNKKHLPIGTILADSVKLIREIHV